MGQAEHRRRNWAALLSAAFALAALCNLIEAVTDPDGWAWTGLRITLSALFLVTLSGWLIAVLRQRHAA